MAGDLLHGVGPTDAATLILAPALLLAVAAALCWFPARLFRTSRPGGPVFRV